MLQIAITVILAIVISVFMDLVGVLLISALLIVPVATAILCSNSFRQTIASAILFSEISVLLGFYFSYTLDFPVGATIVLFNIFILFIVLMIVRIRKRFIKKET